MQKRINKLKKLIKREYPSLDALLIKSPSNIYYLTQINNLEGYLLFTHQESILFTDFRYYQEARKKLSSLFKIKMLKGKWLELILREVKKSKIRKIGLEVKDINLKEYEQLKSYAATMDIELISTQNIVENIRAIKEEREIKLIKEAAKIARQAFLYAESIIYPGLSEKYIDVEIEHFLKTKADLDLAFSPIVASGKNTSFPHHRPGERKISLKDVILIDLGAKYHGYCSDLTRIFVLSKMPFYVKRIFDIMKKAKDLAINKIKAGVKISEVDKIARSYIDKKGYGKYFLHSLGHGVGLDVHETPIVNSRNSSILKENMVITIEPGIYLKERFGVREENMILVKSHKAEVIA